MALLTVTSLSEPGAFALEGELDVTGEAALTETLDRALRENERVTLDLAGLSFMDSTGLRVLLRFGMERDGRKPIVLLRPSSAVRRLFEVALPEGAPGLELRQ